MQSATQELLDCDSKQPSLLLPISLIEHLDMPDRNPFQKLLRARVAAAIGQAKAAAAFTHQGVKGEIVERLVSQLFSPLLPADIGVGSGQILCSYTGNLSPQVDIILYDRAILPPFLHDQRLGMFPIEAVFCAIEVKTTVDMEELRTAHDNALKLLTDFGYRPGLYDDNGKEQQHNINKVRSVVFALGSDLSGRGRSEVDRYKEVQGTSFAAIRALCVSGREYWYEADGTWYGVRDNDEFDGVLTFLAGVMNTYRSVSMSRGHPLLGNYIAADAIPECVKARFQTPVLRCSSCAGTFNMEVPTGKAKLIVQDTLISSTPCPSCGGELRSQPDTFQSIGGVLLHDSTPVSAQPR